MPMTYTGIREAQAILGAFPVEMKAGIRSALEGDVGLVTTKAKGNAAQVSSEIPGQISGTVKFGSRAGGIELRAAEFGYPHRGKARVFEGNGESPSQFLAPNWGRADGHVMSTNPYLHRAAEEELPVLQASIASAVAAALKGL